MHIVPNDDDEEDILYLPTRHKIVTKALFIVQDMGDKAFHGDEP